MPVCECVRACVHACVYVLQYLVCLDTSSVGPGVSIDESIDFILENDIEQGPSIDDTQ